MPLLYLCIVDLREEFCAPTRKNLRAHGGGEISIEMRQREIKHSCVPSVASATLRDVERNIKH